MITSMRWFAPIKSDLKTINKNNNNKNDIEKTAKIL